MNVLVQLLDELLSMGDLLGDHSSDLEQVLALHQHIVLQILV